MYKKSQKTKEVSSKVDRVKFCHEKSINICFLHLLKSQKNRGVDQ